MKVWGQCENHPIDIQQGYITLSVQLNQEQNKKQINQLSIIENVGFLQELKRLKVGIEFFQGIRNEDKNNSSHYLLWGDKYSN